MSADECELLGRGTGLIKVPRANTEHLLVEIKSIQFIQVENGNDICVSKWIKIDELVQCKYCAMLSDYVNWRVSLLIQYPTMSPCQRDFGAYVLSQGIYQLKY